MSSFEDLQVGLSALHAEFAAPMEKLDDYWLAGFQNVNTELVNALFAADEDYFPTVAARAYVTPPKAKADLPQLYEMTWRDTYEVTPYALLAVKVRFCIGYLGNASLGQLISQEQCEVLIFGYEAYWKFGKEYILGSVVESLLSRLSKPSEWTKNLNASEETGEDKARSALVVGIANAMQELYAHYRSAQAGGHDGFSTSPKPKPDFIDFRPRLKAIGGPPVKPSKRRWFKWW